MHAAIVEDLASDMSILYDNICRYCEEHKTHMQVDRYSDGTEFISACATVTYDLIFLDIYLKDTSGIQIASRVRKLHPNCPIIFITTSKEHAVDAFRLHALDYPVKPFTYEQLEDSLNHFEQIFHHFEHYITLKEGRQHTRIRIPDILYTDYSNHYIQVHTESAVIRSYMSFDQFSPMLTPYPQFLWCYRNCMVNMDYIETLEERDFVLKNGERIPISRAKRNEIIQAYADYIFDYVNRGKLL